MSFGIEEICSGTCSVWTSFLFQIISISFVSFTVITKVVPQSIYFFAVNISIILVLNGDPLIFSSNTKLIYIVGIIIIINDLACSHNTVLV